MRRRANLRTLSCCVVLGACASGLAYAVGLALSIGVKSWGYLSLRESTLGLH